MGIRANNRCAALIVVIFHQLIRGQISVIHKRKCFIIAMLHSGKVDLAVFSSWRQIERSNTNFTRSR